MALREVNEGLISGSGADPANGCSSHDGWIGVADHEIVTVGTIAAHRSHCLDGKSFLNLRDKVAAEEGGELFDALDELNADKFTPVGIVGALVDCQFCLGSKEMRVPHINGWRIER